KPLFERMGVSPKDLENVRNADEFLLLIADRIKKVGDEAQQVDVLGQMNLGDLQNLTKLGAEGIDKLGAAASGAGRVLAEEMIARLRDADKAMSDSKAQIDNLRMAAFAPLAEAIGKAAGQTTTFLVEMDKLVQRSPRWVNALRSVIGG